MKKVSQKQETVLRANFKKKKKRQDYFKCLFVLFRARNKDMKDR